MSRPPFYLRGGIPKQGSVLSQPMRTTHPSAPVQRRMEIFDIPREEFVKLLTFLNEKYGGNIQRKWNSFYDSAFAKVAFLKSSEVVVLLLTDASSKNINLFEMKISDIELAPPIDVSREFYGHLRRHIDSTIGRETFRRGNNFYTEDGTLVAELISPEKVRIHTQIRTGLFEKTTTTEINIAGLKPEIAPMIEVSREYYGYLRRHIAMRAGAETFRKGNNFYADDGTLVAELLSPEKVRIYTPTGSSLFAKTVTAEIEIASLKPKRIYIPRELLYITKKLFGSYRRFDRGVRMDRNNDQGKSSSLIASLNLPEYAKAFFGKATQGLIEGEVKYLVTHWADDISNKRRAHANQVSNTQPRVIYLPAPPRSVPASPLIESAEIFIDEESLSVEERLETMHRLGLDQPQQQQQQARSRVPSRQTDQTRFYSRPPSSPAVLRRHELRKLQDLDRALRREDEQNAPVTGV